MSVEVLGLDGAPGGWIGAHVIADDAAASAVRVSLRLYARFEEVLALDPLPAAIGVDMPIGLDEPAQIGGRACERAARALLGPRRASVFSAPARPTLAANSYEEALRLNRTGGGPGLSKQAFNIMAKIKEVDAALLGAKPGVRERVCEVHPELAFMRLAGSPSAHPKRTAAGRAERIAALVGAGVPRAACDPHPFARKAAACDDVLDALAVALSALSIARGDGQRLPATGLIPRDRLGLAQLIWY